MPNTCPVKKIVPAQISYLKESFAKDHNQAITCIAIADDESLLAVGSDDCTISIWSTKTTATENLGKLVGHEAQITCLAMYDTVVVSGSADRSIKRWDMETLECLYTFMGHTDVISRVHCTEDFIFSSSYDSTAKVWVFEAEIYTKEGVVDLVKTFEGHTGALHSLIFIPDVKTPDRPEDGLNIRENDMVLTGGADSTARSWSLVSGFTLQVFRGHKTPISSMSLDVSGTELYTGSIDGDIRAFKISTGTCLKVIKGHTGSLSGLMVVNQFKYSGSSDGVARSWRDVNNRPKRSVSALQFHNGILYTGCGDYVIRAFDVVTGEMIRHFKGHKKAISSLIVIDNKLFSGCYDGCLKIWDTNGIEKEIPRYEKSKKNDPFYQKVMV